MLLPQYEGIQYKIESRKQKAAVGGEKNEAEGPARQWKGAVWGTKQAYLVDMYKMHTYLIMYVIVVAKPLSVLIMYTEIE